jgi:thioesterase domain-containing protein
VAAAGYRPRRPFPGRIVFIQARDEPNALHLASRLGWAELAERGLDVRLARGYHANLLDREHAPAVAEDLRAILADCQGTAG